MTVVIDRVTPPEPSEPRAPGAGPESAAQHARKRAAPGASLYKPRAPIYPKLVHGLWRRVKWILLIGMLAVYYVTPWIRWRRPEGLPQQAALVDFDGGRFYFFDLQIWPQEVYFITGVLVVSALGLFLVTSLFGRLWCGYACPQTVWTDLFIYVERAFEGDRNARMRLDAAPWTFNKLWRKGGKHLVWLGVAFGTGGAWIFYFRDAPTLLREFWTGQAPLDSYVSCLLLTATTYVFAGHMREQVCTYMCPWPRIQGAMLDEHSLQVTYRYDRGEPRGAHKKDASWEGRGDCVDCNACVVACPMGIDIRDGNQLECINCGLCVDACDEIMDRVDRPRGLIAYDTDSAIADHVEGRKPVYKFIRPRTIYYAGALTLVGAIMLWGLTHRQMLDLHVLRDRNPTFVRLHDGSIRNAYTLKIANKTFAPVEAEIDFHGVPHARVRTPGEDEGKNEELYAMLQPNQVTSIRVVVTAPAAELTSANLPATFEAYGHGIRTSTKTVFLSGAN